MGQEWAVKGEYKHSKSYQIKSPAGPAGENLALGHATIAAANAAWYAEVKDCTSLPGCKTGKDGAAVGHFTALIWKGVTEMGCGTANVEGRNMYVCRYRSGPKLDCNTPNMSGCYRKNVLPKVKSTKQCYIDPPAAPAGQPGAKPMKTTCKATDSSNPYHNPRPYVIKTYKRKAFTSRCAWVKQTGRCKLCA